MLSGMNTPMRVSEYGLSGETKLAIRKRREGDGCRVCRGCDELISTWKLKNGTPYCATCIQEKNAYYNRKRKERKNVEQEARSEGIQENGAEGEQER